MIRAEVGVEEFNDLEETDGLMLWRLNGTAVRLE
jgi:hypothetical protein